MTVVIERRVVVVEDEDERSKTASPCRAASLPPPGPTHVAVPGVVPSPFILGFNWWTVLVFF